MLRESFRQREDTELKNKKGIGGEDMQDDARSEATNESRKEDSTNDDTVTRAAAFHSRMVQKV